MTIKVVIADDHPIVRSGVRNELVRHQDIEMVGEATNGDEVLRLVETLAVDVLLLDINMPGVKAVTVIRTLKSRPNPPHVLVLTAYGDLENVLGMLQAGANGYLLKDEDPSSIAEGLRAVAQGRTWLSSAVAQSLVGRVTEDETQAAPEPLSDREKEVLRWLAQGNSNAQIAEGLAISEGTVKNHVTTLYDRLGVHSRAEAVAWAWQHGIAGAK
jgi:DNA-binding NarL/FixJ family response regulator